MDYASAHTKPFEPSPRESEDSLDSYLGPYNESSATIIPITQERIMNLDTKDAGSVSRFFQGIADSVVMASTLPAEVEELRGVVNQLKADVEAYREHNARMDEEITNLRKERQALQDENAQLRAAGDREHTDHMLAQERWGQACQERDRWHNESITVSTLLEEAKRERDDAQMKIMELEDSLRSKDSELSHIRAERDELYNRLSSIRSALA